jgi:hypothetical protein
MLAPHTMKASATHGPDTPRLHKAMAGEHREAFLSAMGKEISELEFHGTWTIIRKASMPKSANLPFKVRRYPDGRMHKHKATRFCVRGDKQIEGVDYFESYAPVVAWSTVRMIMNMTVQRRWATQQVDFLNAFVQASLSEEVYVELPAMFADEQSNGKENGVILKLNKSLSIDWFRHRDPGIIIFKRDFKNLILHPPSLTQEYTMGAE